MAVALSQRGPFSEEKYTLNSTTAGDTVSARTFSLGGAVFIPALPETIEVLIEGVKLKGDGLQITAGSGDEFYVNSATNPTTVTIETNSRLNTIADSTITTLASGNLLVIRRISNRSSKNVDYAPGSVIREIDLDNSNIQILHVAQEAMDIAISGMVLGADDEFDAKSKVIANVADGVADNDATNVGQINDHDVITAGYRDVAEAYKEDAEDYKLESADWSQKVDGGVKVYADNSVTGSALGFSAKAHAIGGTDVTGASGQGSAKDWAIGGGGVMATEPDGSEFSAKEYAQGVTAAGGTSKEWAQTTGVAIDTTYSSKEYAQGSVLAAGGSAKNWSQLATTPSTGANDRSSKSWSQGASMTGSTLGGSSKDWANTLVTQIDGTDYSSKENATGVTVGTGSSKQWAVGGGSFVEATVVAGGVYSAKKYASDSASSAIAAASHASAFEAVPYVHDWGAITDVAGTSSDYGSL